MDKMREEFEAWYAEQFKYSDKKLNRHGETYLSPFVGGLWSSWKASREALCVELPSFENGSIRSYSGDCDEARMVVDSAAESLDKAGVSYK